MLGVATVEEGVELREGGIRLPVVVLGGVDPPQAAEAHAHGLSAVLFDLGQIGYLAARRRRPGVPSRCTSRSTRGWGGSDCSRGRRWRRRDGSRRIPLCGWKGG